MKILKSVILAACAACACIAAAPAVSAQPSPAMIMARTVCFDGIKALQSAYVVMGGAASDASDRVDELLKQYVPASADRDATIRNGESLISAAPGPLELAQVEVRLCAATVGAAADGGTRSLDDFKRLWANDRITKFKLGAPADPSAPAAPPAAAAPNTPAASPEPVASAAPLLDRTARRVCANEIKIYEDALVGSGESAASAKNILDDVFVTFLQDAEPRAHVLDSFDQMAGDAAAKPLDVKRLAVSACAATMGSLWSVGMRNYAELNTHWAGRGRARFAQAGHPQAPEPFSCIWMDWDVEGFGSPGTLRNSCPFTIDLRFCMAQVKAGTPTEAVDCDKGRSRFERIEAGGGVHTALTEGSIIRWAACKVPLQPVDTTVPGGSFKATCK